MNGKYVILMSKIDKFEDLLGHEGDLGGCVHVGAGVDLAEVSNGIGTHALFLTIFLGKIRLKMLFKNFG